MKKVVPILGLLLIAGVLYAFVWNPSEPATSTNEEELSWLSWEEMVEAQESNPKKILIDVYTDWCGWCKRMDATTFVDPGVVEYLNEHFHVVKFDAEQKEDIVFRGHTMKFQPNGRRGSHELAISLLNGRMSYPSIVYLNESLDRISISPGFKPAPDLMNELEYVAGEHYQTMTFDTFMQEND